MNIKNHINLIKNHGYKGKIGIAKEAIRGMCLAAKPGDIVLYRPYEVREGWHVDEETREWDRTHCSIETPMSEEQIQAEKAKGSALTVYGTCVGVPLSLIEELVID